ncbi:transposase [Halobacteriovorax sp. GFR7]|uniref:transposase n=1 Tax=unclassified Halobacteriovorax TaxID=2639665 RepID=UPI003D99E3C2
MPRKPIIRTNLCPYHVYIRTNNKEWFDIPMPTVWNYCLKSIKYAQNHHPVEIQAFVLMTNHYHLLIWTPNFDIDRFMFFMNSHLSKLIRRETGRINRIFGDRYKWSIVKDQKYYQTVLRYVYQNPNRKGITQKCQDYEFSTLSYVIKNEDLGFKLKDPIIGDTKNFLEWVNQEDEKFSSTRIKDALTRPEFKIKNNRTSRRI